MKTTTEKISRFFAQITPGTPANAGAIKRRIEKQLRADGWSRTTALIEATKRFNEGKYE